MSATAPTQENLGQAVAQTALSTAEAMMPMLLAAISAGQTAAAPQAALIAMAAQVIPPLIQSFGATSAQVQQLMNALVPEIKADQMQYDAIAKARGLVGEVPTAPAAEPVPAAPASPAVFRAAESAGGSLRGREPGP